MYRLSLKGVVPLAESASIVCLFVCLSLRLSFFDFEIYKINVLLTNYYIQPVVINIK